MRTRKEIKAIGRAHFLANYWQCAGAVVLVGLTIFILNFIFAGSSIYRNTTSFLSNSGSMANGIINYNVAYPSSAAPTFSVFSFFGSFITAIISGPLNIGLCFFFISVILNNVEQINVGTPFRSAISGFGRKLGGFWWMILLTFLWSLLFIIPGIIKSFSYAMTPYILADCPNVRATDALKLSKRIMAGHKGELFVFYLSFLGWTILSLFTFGLLQVFYVQPYMESSLATYYLEVREAALNNGTITMGQLQGIETV